MVEKVFEGEQALGLVKSFAILELVNNVLPNFVNEAMAKYEGEITEKMSKDTFCLISMYQALDYISKNVTDDVRSITGLTGEDISVSFNECPKITIYQKEEEKLEGNK